MNRHDSGRFCTESLESAAKRYKTLGFSIIPLLGARNPQQPKLPAIKWARFQHTHPSGEELQSWFHDRDDAGIGIVCGRVSRLIVLDFDDASIASEFRRLYPELLDTFTVRSGTRQLPHLYYRLPEGKLITTSAYAGVDLRGEGAYVVAPPTRVRQVEWQVENGAPIHAISEFELRRVMRFLASLKVVEVQSSKAVAAVQKAEVSEFRHLPPEAELVTNYHQLCNLGRNQALFKVAMMARDRGISEAACCLILAPVHGREPGAANEDYGTRYTEAIRTIASTYKRPPRQSIKTATHGLGNAVREWLLGNSLASLARVLDGLYVVGVKPDEYFTELDACQKLAELKIGRRSIMAALKATVGEWRVFEIVDTPLNPPSKANAAIGSDNLYNSCKMSRGAKRVKIGKRGRPAKGYRLPSPDEVAQKIGIQMTSSDAVVPDDFITPRMYRQALHKQLLERRPGHYARSWLGERLGVSRWTTRRYEKAANLYVRPAFATQPLTWLSAAKLPQTTVDTSYGVFLEISDGKRYPAFKGLALKLLKQGCAPVLKHQRTNYYATKCPSVGIPTPQLLPQIETVNSFDYSLSKNQPLQNKLGVGIPTVSSTRSVEKTHAEKAKRLPSVGIPTLQAAQDCDVSLSGVGIPTPLPYEPTFWFCSNCLDFHVTVNRPYACTRCGHNTDWEIVSQHIWRDAQALKQWWQRRYRDHQQGKREGVLATLEQNETILTPHAKALAKKVRDQIPNLSWANALRLVREFSEHLIEKALLVVRGRIGLRSPAGFLIAFLKSEHKLLLSNNTNNSEVGKRESSLDWVKRLAKSKYLSFIANADDILNLNLEITNDALPA